jgi:hypothetical protein
MAHAHRVPYGVAGCGAGRRRRVRRGRRWRRTWSVGTRAGTPPQARRRIAAPPGTDRSRRRPRRCWPQQLASPRRRRSWCRWCVASATTRCTAGPAGRACPCRDLTDPAASPRTRAGRRAGRRPAVRRWTVPAQAAATRTPRPTGTAAAARHPAQPRTGSTNGCGPTPRTATWARPIRVDTPTRPHRREPSTPR